MLRRYLTDEALLAIGRTTGLAWATVRKYAYPRAFMAAGGTGQRSPRHLIRPSLNWLGRNYLIPLRCSTSEL
jgi:hypothetical protein